jgi:hypothetical protein
MKKDRPGHLEVIGETAAKLIFFEKGWNPYSRFLDEDKVDLVLRRKRDNKPEYREIQVKYRRLYENSSSNWASKLFTTTLWYEVKPDEFINHRPNLFVLFVFGYPNQAIEKDVLIFPSSDLHKIIKLSPKVKGGERRVLYISKAANDNGWFVWRKRSKFEQINSNTCQNVSKYLNNFELLE